MARIEAVDSDGHLRSCPGLGVVDGGRRTRSYDRLAAPLRIRVVSWNVGSLTREAIGSWRFQWLFEGETANVIGADAPQVGLSDAEKKRFWNALDELRTDTRVHGGFGFGDRNEEGCTILEFATAHELVVANSFFKKSDAHLITFQNGVTAPNYFLEWGHNTQIDYMLVRRGDLKACKDCRAYPGEACSSQHRLVIVDVLFERRRHMREATRKLRILWKNLKGEAVETFRATVVERLAALEEVMSASGADEHPCSRYEGCGKGVLRSG
uniref:Retrovirus-related Pol polyprotein LINE-1 n=1 Tax=Tanacetum cinerariifolium TaxID=118510 RepID=A0A699H335_TANCI|nr:retrovirus-related Pol polyprotein LINE-1 [Tanacetum cinerariifolium]